MKYKMLALVLALTVVSWAQTATPASPSTQEQSAPTDKKGSCCDKADAKDAHACCAHHDMKDKSGKDMASCCAGKDAKSCSRKSDDKTAMSCCKDSCSKDKTASACCGGTCGKEGDKGCCSKKGDKTAKSCCNHELKG